MSALDSTLIRILLFDSHAIVRAGLRLLLDSSPGFQVVGDTGHIADAIAVANREKPDIILFEAASDVGESGSQDFAPASFNGKVAPGFIESSTVEAAAGNSSPEMTAQPAAQDFPASSLYSFISESMPDMGTTPDAIDFLPVFFEVAPDTQIIVLTGSTDGQIHRRVVAQGAKGLLQKECSPEVLKRAIECVYAGEVWIERTMMASVLAEIAQTGNSTLAATPRPASLTRREREVITLLCEGLPNRQISARLCISETTVRRHLTTIFAKLGVSDRLELVIYAYRHGLAMTTES